MIALIVSVLSFLVIVFVTVYLINKSIDEENDRKADVRKVVDQVNNVNSSAADIEKKQNTTMADLNIAITSLRNDVASVNSDMDQLRSDASLKEDLQKSFKTTSAEINTLSVNQAKISQDSSQMLNISMAASNSSNVSRITGFDNSSIGKRMTLGTELSILESGQSNLYHPFDSRGDIFMMSQSNTRLMFQSGKNIGIVVKGDKVGVGMDPKTAQLDVKGGINVVSDNTILMGGSNASKALSVGKFGELVINEGQGFKGTVVRGTLGIEGDLFLPNGDLRTADGRPLSLGDNLNIDGTVKLWGSNILAVDDTKVMLNNYDQQVKQQVVIGGRSITLGNTTFNTSNNNSTNVFYNSAMRFAPKEEIPQKWTMTMNSEGVQASNMVSYNLGAMNNAAFRGIYPNSDQTKFWSVYNNNNSDFVFDPTRQQLPASTDTGVGVARISPEGNFTAKGTGQFSKSVTSDGDITSLQNVVGQQLCIKNAAKNICLDKNQLEWIISKYTAEMVQAPK